MKRIHRIAATACAACLASQAHALTYNEASSGDLSNSGLAPTAVGVALGANTVLGTTGNPGTGIDRDYFSITVPAGAQLSTLRVLAGTAPLGLAFLGVQAGSQVTVVPTSGLATGLLGWYHYAATDIGTDVLPGIGQGAGATGFSGALGAGNYAFWVQDFNAGASTYAFELTLTPVPVPEPAAAWTLLAGLGALTALARWRRRPAR